MVNKFSSNGFSVVVAYMLLKLFIDVVRYYIFGGKNNRNK